uniref:Peptidase S74 domain-containing protein n=1 Tax=viral metagenome TaxID=1070528 RepID=A0A6C0EP75_9ZZZZ
MSILSTVANYGGKVGDYQTDIKQFYVSDVGTAVWIYKKSHPYTSNPFITPANQNYNILIPKDLTVLGSINNPSDANLKKNIESIDNENIDSIFDLNPVKFNYNYEENGKTHYGFIAQDTEKVFPELVSSYINEEENEYKTINYLEIIPLLLSKMKKMQNEIDELKEQLKNTK